MAAAGGSSGKKNNKPRANHAEEKKNPKRWKKSPFADFGSYMVEKNRKLREQFDADADASNSSLGSYTSGDARGLFHDVSIFVDGFTVPSSQELRGYMVRHGGRFENYFSRHRVTHIICSNLPDSKLRNFRAFSRGLPVVKPAWVLDSVAANKILSWVPYQLTQLVSDPGKQQKLSTFFTSKRILRSEDVDAFVDSGDKLDLEGLLFDKKKSKQVLVSGECAFSESREEVVEESAHVLGEESGERETEKPASSDRKESKQVLVSGECEFSESREEVVEESAHVFEEESGEGGTEKPASSEPDNDHSIAEVFDIGPYGTSSVVKTGAVASNDSLSLKSSEPSCQRRAAHKDPEFVQNYFKKSRLHFIGTWRNRYRKRFMNIQNGLKESNAALDSLAAPRKTAIIHIDMDCFFVSVITRNYPELLDKPVAVCHSDNPRGTAEISSANYPARGYGVRAGMFVRDAKVHCPQLVIVPYDFEAYEEVADQFYSILHKHCSKVQALSCDEAFLDVTGCCNDDPEQLAKMIRKEIAGTTRCTASAGIAGNLLLARLATRSAKPNGQYFILPDKVDNFLKDLPIMSLPGIGHSLGQKLQSRQIQTCGQLLLIPKESLNQEFGTKTGDMLWNYCRGVDNRTVDLVQETKSVGAEVNWGVRFNDTSECQNFLVNLCKEVSLRLQGCGVKGRTITLKVKRRKKGAAEPTKFMGCGDCESFSRSVTLPVATDDITLLQRTSKQLFSSFHFDVKEVRGVGLQLTRLENVDITRQGHDDNKLEAWLASASGKTGEQYKEFDFSVMEKHNVAVAEPLLPGGESKQGFKDYTEVTGSGSSHNDLSNIRSHGSSTSTLPPLCHLDIDVIKDLPHEIVSEINDMYNGKLLDLMEKHNEREGRTQAYLLSISFTERNEATSSSSCKKGCGDTIINTIDGEVQYGGLDSVGGNKGKPPLCSSAFMCNVLPKTKVESARGNCISMSTGVNKIDLMPASLSQADISVLQQLPEDVKVDVYELLPAHRQLNSSGNVPSSLVSKHPHDMCVKNSANTRFYLWEGDPPNWVEKFKASTFFILNLLANLYSTVVKDDLLSSVMHSLVSFLPLVDSGSGGCDESLSSLCDLFRQYIYFKIESHIEELYICFRLLKSLVPVIIFFEEACIACYFKLSAYLRVVSESDFLAPWQSMEEAYDSAHRMFSAMSGFFLRVYNLVLPFLQISVRENYGGELPLSLVKE